MGAERDRDRGVDACQLLDREHVGERVAASASELLGERDSHQPELGELAHDVVRERARPVELLRDRSDLAQREVTDSALDELVMIGEAEVHP